MRLSEGGRGSGARVWDLARDRTQDAAVFDSAGLQPAAAGAAAGLGGVPQTILYDNTKLAVAQILGDGTRKRTQAFSELQSHYLFGERFGFCL
jgi:hypothetical protein